MDRILFVIMFNALHSIGKFGVHTQESVGDGMIREYCQGESFSASCNQGEVITMTTAQYGSMKIGRCLEEDYGHLGCATDVLDIADRECSGEKNCNILITNKEMDAVRKCPRDLGRYFEGSYICRKVLSPPYQRCNRALVTTIQSGYLASTVAKDTSCGLSDYPWTLAVQQGQQINLTLTSFTWTKSVQDQNVSHNCDVKLGYLFDLETEEVVHICPGVSRVRHLYLSKGSQLQVLLDRAMVDKYSFLIQYQATGCPDMAHPEGSWVQRQDDTLTVGCHSNQETWTLKCRSGHWIGLNRNCSHKQEMKILPDLVAQPVVSADKEDYSRNLLIVTVVGCVTLFSCVVILVTGVVCIKRLKKHKYSTGSTHTAGSVNFPANRNSVLTTYLPVFNPSQQNTMATVNRNQPAPCLLSHQSSGGEPCVCETQTYKSATDRDSVQYYVLDQDYMANSQIK